MKSDIDRAVDALLHQEKEVNEHHRSPSEVTATSVDEEIEMLRGILDRFQGMMPRDLEPGSWTYQHAYVAVNDCAQQLGSLIEVFDSL